MSFWGDFAPFSNLIVISLATRVSQHDPESESMDLLHRRPFSRDPLIPQSFTWRAVIVGLLVGVLINLCNTYYGLQTGAGAQLPTVSALLGCLAIGALAKFNFAPLSETENVLIVSTATATGCMPATAGFTEVIPALEYILGPNEGGPFRLGYLQMITWSLGLSFFGILFAALLIDRLIFPSLWPWPGATC